MVNIFARLYCSVALSFWFVYEVHGANKQQMFLWHPATAVYVGDCETFLRHPVV